jgi:cell division septal protein FtsQ
VHVSRSWINRLHIEIVEHTIAACALVEDDMYHILSDGVLIHEDASMRANCDELMVQGLTNEEVEAGVPGLFVRQLMNVNPEVRDLIQIIEFTPLYGDIHRFSLFMIDGNTVIVSSHTMPERLNLYPHLLAYIESGQTGTFHLDVGRTFIPHGN